MPVLPRPRHEAFAQAIFRSLFEPDKYPTNGHAYKAAGYRASLDRTTASAAEVNASRLLKKANIIARVQELQQEAASRAQESIDKFIQELNEDRKLATRLEMPSAASAATMGKAKLLGLVTDKHADVTDRLAQATNYNDIGKALLESVGYAAPSAADVALALDAHKAFTAQLEAIAERAQAGSQS